MWSAACSSGEEPYSIAMVLADHFGEGPWEVVASDISTRVLDRARTGHYPMERTSGISHEHLSRYCLKGVGSQENTLLVEHKLRSRVNFMQVNLNQPLPALGEFDLIFLRNVMIYFDHGNQAPGDAAAPAPAQAGRAFPDQSFGKPEWRGGYAASAGAVDLSQAMNKATLRS